MPDGLADPNVYILDPCCGTGSYLIEVLDRIAATLRAKGADALSAQEIKRAATKLLGARTLDVYLNNLAYWRNVPSRIWEWTIGGYQVIKKWLSYREREILGRGLNIDEVHAVTGTARRIATILLLEPRLDANYETISTSAYEWPSTE